VVDPVHQVVGEKVVLARDGGSFAAEFRRVVLRMVDHVQPELHMVQLSEASFHPPLIVSATATTVSAHGRHLLLQTGSDASPGNLSRNDSENRATHFATAGKTLGEMAADDLLARGARYDNWDATSRIHGSGSIPPGARPRGRKHRWQRAAPRGGQMDGSPCAPVPVGRASTESRESGTEGR